MPHPLYLLPFIASAAAAAASPPPSVHTPLGVVEGKNLEPGVQRFGNVPYAEAPLGNLRLARAVEHTTPHAAGTLDARTLGPPCINNPLGDPRPPTDLGEAPAPSENCMKLNIWRPAGAGPQSKLPIMVWLFGGGLCGGFAGNSFYSGEHLAREHNVIVVSVSYRLGALGWLPIPDPARKDAGSGGLNGANDVIVALQWVQHNMGHFGGDTNAVTLFGQSSGSYLTCVLCVAPRAKGLFSRAILQSGPCFGGLPGKGWGPRNATYGKHVTHQVLSANNATSIGDLRRASQNASLIQWPDDAMNDLSIAPYFPGYFDDTFVVPDIRATSDDEAAVAALEATEAMWAAGRINPDAILVGANSKDGTAGFYGTAPTLGMIPPDKKQMSEADYKTAVLAAWGEDAGKEILAQYPMSRPDFKSSPQAAFIQGDADANVICPTRAIAAYAARAGREVFHYEFRHFQPNREPGKQGWGCDNGVELDLVPGDETSALNTGWATHGAETHFVFNTESGPDGLGPPNNFTVCSFNAAEAHLSRTMMAYWANFATTGRPTGSGAPAIHPEWPQARPVVRPGMTAMGANMTTQRLEVSGDGEATADGIRPEVQIQRSLDCAFWDRLRRGKKTAAEVTSDAASPVTDSCVYNASLGRCSGTCGHGSCLPASCPPPHFPCCGCPAASSLSAAPTWLRHKGDAARRASRGGGNGVVVIIDVRTPAEWAVGHISCAHGPLPIQDNPAGWQGKVAKWTRGNRNVPIVTYCAVGVRAGKAQQLLEAAGYTNVTDGGGYEHPADVTKMERMCRDGDVEVVVV